MRVNIVCSKWGTRYGPHFVNRLKNMARRNCNDRHDFHFYCYTDDADGLDPDIKVIPFPDIPNIHPKYWFGNDTKDSLKFWDLNERLNFELLLSFLHRFLDTKYQPYPHFQSKTIPDY